MRSQPIMNHSVCDLDYENGPYVRKSIFTKNGFRTWGPIFVVQVTYKNSNWILDPLRIQTVKLESHVVSINSKKILYWNNYDSNK